MARAAATGCRRPWAWPAWCWLRRCAPRSTACCTSGGAKELGQILKLSPGNAGAPDRIELYFESENTDQFNFGDNLTVAPSGHLFVCEFGNSRVQVFDAQRGGFVAASLSPHSGTGPYAPYVEHDGQIIEP